MRPTRRLLVAGLGLLGSIAACATAGAAATDLVEHSAASGGLPSGQGALVPAGAIVVADASGRVLVVDRRGRVLRRVPGSFGSAHLAQALALAPDRRHAYISAYTGSGSVTLYVLDLRTGHRRKLATGLSPALNPARTKLAYISLSGRPDLGYEHALVVVDLRAHRTHSIPFPPRVVPGTPPEEVINWSPDGTRIALFDGHTIRLVNLARARRIDAQPALPGSPAGLLAPVFLQPRALVVLAKCCIGRQHLVTIDLATGARHPFATLSSPPQNIWRLDSRTLLVEDALDELVLATREHVHVIANGIAAAAAPT